MQIINGNLITLAQENYFDVIIHGCNCFHIMGAGVAAQIKNYFPEAFVVDKKTAKGDISKLGNYSEANILVNGKNLVIINAYTQFNCSRAIMNTDYDAVLNVFKKIKEDFGNKNYKFGFPKIGAGLGGGDWDIIEAIIEKEMENENICLVVI